ncbi:MAG: chorismate--pyruvate lyase family protein [Aquabacterium sp.]
MRAALPPHRASHRQHLRAWLQAGGSLTARLRRHGVVQVQVCRQGSQRLWAHEARAVGTPHGHVREVVLWVNDRPAVWARSVTAAAHTRGPWRAIKGLGSRPLAEVLFISAGIHREPLQAERWPSHSLPWRHRLQAWHTTLRHPAHPLSAPLPPSPVWGRHSVFIRRGAPLMVTECFAPWLVALAP